MWIKGINFKKGIILGCNSIPGNEKRVFLLLVEFYENQLHRLEFMSKNGNFRAFLYTNPLLIRGLKNRQIVG